MASQLTYQSKSAADQPLYPAPQRTYQLTAVVKQLLVSTHPLKLFTSQPMLSDHQPRSRTSLNRLQATNRGLLGTNLWWIPLLGHFSWLAYPSYIVKIGETSSWNTGWLHFGPGPVLQVYCFKLSSGTVKLHSHTPTLSACSCLLSCMFYCFLSFLGLRFLCWVFVFLVWTCALVLFSTSCII